MPAPPAVSRRRADAERNIRAILDAAGVPLTNALAETRRLVQLELDWFRLPAPAR